MKERLFIAGSREYNTISRHVSAPLFRKVFESETDNALLRIAAVGFYRLFLNGKELTKGFLAPYISNPDHVVYYDEYPLSGLKKQGNVLNVLLGNGFGNANDNGLWDFDKASFRAAPRFYLEIEGDGKRLLSTDDSFSVCDSPIEFDDLRCGERYDARREDASVFGEVCTAALRPALVVPPPRGEWRKCAAEPVRAFQRLRAKRILKEKDGSYLYDFGENNAGVCTLRIDGEPGQTIDLYFGEAIGKGGLDMRSVSFGERSPADYVQHDRYICRGGRAEYTPSFTYHGFRYVRVVGVGAEQATGELLEYVVLHSDIPVRGRFFCGDDVLDRLQDCTLRSDLSNFYYFPTDCPQREKNGWTADASLSAEQMLYNLGAANSLREWLFHIRKAQTAEGQLPGIVPTAGWGYEWGNGPAWDSVLIELPYQLFRFTGEREIVRENADAIVRYFGYLKSKKNADGLFAFGLGDWCEAGTFSEDGHSTPLEVTDSLVCVDLARKAAFLLGEIGRPEKAEIEAFGKALVSDFRRKYTAGGPWETQTGLAMALAFGIFTQEEEPLAYARLKALIHAQGDVFKVGVLGARQLFSVLSAHKDAALAYRLITQLRFPSYAYNLSFGATTLWEAFQEYEEGGDEIVRKDGGERILSFNHHFWGSVSAWMYESLAGLKLLSARRAEISPDCIPPLAYAGAEYRDGEAFLRSRWERREGKIVLTVENKGFEVTVKTDCGQESAPQGESVYVLSGN